jgi:hypothetical protein
MRIPNWEFWPMNLAIVPTILMWLVFSIRARSLFFFSTVNPAMESGAGGMMGEEKNQIMECLPPAYLPVTAFVPVGRPWNEIQAQLNQLGLSYPLIAKPNVGERGLRVLKAEDEEALRQYHENSHWDYLIQEFVDFPLEISVFYHRFPGQGRGAITSLCFKEYLSVSGNGRSSVRSLMENNIRSRLQIERLAREKPALLDSVPAAGERVLLEPIGNHSRGTKFLNANHLIDDELTAAFDRISNDMQGMYYGRFDIKCESWERLKAAEGFKILEYNGAAAEPAHIFDPSVPIWKKYRDTYLHWAIMYRIYRAQRQNGIRPIRWRQAREIWRRYYATIS